MLGTDFLQCSREDIEVYLADKHWLFTRRYTGPDAHMLEESAFLACGRDPERYQEVRVGSTIGPGAMKDSTLGTYITCLQSGWGACIDERNRKPENNKDPWDYLAHPMSKVTEILCDYIVPRISTSIYASAELFSCLKNVHCFIEARAKSRGRWSGKQSGKYSGQARKPYKELPCLKRIVNTHLWL